MDSKWKKAFDTFILLVIGYTCILTVFSVCFDYQTTGKLSLVDNLVTLFFILDIMFKFFQEFLDVDSFKKVRKIKEIAKNYLQSWFIFDFIATFPFDWIAG